MIALIDGDVLCYNSCEPRNLRTRATVEDLEIVALDDEGRKIVPTFSMAEDAQYLEECWERLRKTLTKIQDQLFCEDQLTAVKSSLNFRDELYPLYKAKRSHQPGTEVVQELRNRMIEEGLAIEAVGREADDMLGIWAKECRSCGEDYVVCSIDKDLLCIPGTHYRMFKGREFMVEVSELEARRNFYEQLLKGDPVDNVPGLPRVGEVGARKALADCMSEEEMQEVAVGMYIAAYGDDWLNMLLSNGKMVYIQSAEDDHFKVSHWPVVKELL